MSSETPHHNLHEAYLRCKSSEATPVVAEKIGLSTRTLLRFEREGLVSWSAKQAIATWVRAQEPRRSLSEAVASLRQQLEGTGEQVRATERPRGQGLSQ